MAAAVAFTGGKDCVLVLHLAAGFQHPLVPPLPAGVPPVRLLVTFGPSANPDFRAHPLPVIRAIAAALKLPHVLCEVDGQPSYQASYARQLRSLAAQHGITALVTGDMLDVARGFLEAAVAEAGGGLQLVRPLWQLPRASALQAGLDLGIRSRISCVDVSKYSGCGSSSSGGGGSSNSSCSGVFDATAKLLGQELTPALVAGALAEAAELCNADLAGERGEYHTLVVACPLMGGDRELRLQAGRVQQTPGGSHVYIEWAAPELVTVLGSDHSVNDAAWSGGDDASKQEQCRRVGHCQ